MQYRPKYRNQPSLLLMITVVVLFILLGIKPGHPQQTSGDHPQKLPQTVQEVFAELEEAEVTFESIGVTRWPLFNPGPVKSAGNSSVMCDIVFFGPAENVTFILAGGSQGDTLAVGHRVMRHIRSPDGTSNRLITLSTTSEIYSRKDGGWIPDRDDLVVSSCYDYMRVRAAEYLGIANHFKTYRDMTSAPSDHSR